jgi:hypothetical protein
LEFCGRSAFIFFSDVCLRYFRLYFVVSFCGCSAVILILAEIRPFEGTTEISGSLQAKYVKTMVPKQQKESGNGTKPRNIYNINIYIYLFNEQHQVHP